jgi:predicted site-specific integrase-resolvase
MTPIYTRVKDAPKIFGLTRTTIYRWANAGKITIHKVDGCSFLKIAEVSAIIENKLVDDATTN